jgi:predicted transposase/invertase (TIGR01784 family)
MTLAYDMHMVAKEAAEVAAKEAFEDGFSAGEERGRNEAKIETAKSMKQENMSVSLIARFTGLTPEEIEKL